METEGNIPADHVEHKCVYENPELPCRNCRERGFSCGIQDKVFGPKTQALQRDQPTSLDRPLPIPHESSFTELESLYVQHLFCDFPKFCPSYVISCKGWQRSVVANDDVTKRVASLLFTSISKPVRYALLATAALRFDGGKPQRVLQYLGLCYQQLQKAISDASLVDVVYGSYLVSQLAMEIESPSVISIHCLGLSQSLKLLAATPKALTPNEWFSLEHSCLSAFVRIRKDYTPRLLKQSSSKEFQMSTFAQEIEKLFAQAQTCYSNCLIPKEVLAAQSLDVQTALTFSRLGNSFGFYLYYYLWRLNNPSRHSPLIEELAGELHRVVKDLTDFLPRYNLRLRNEIQNLTQTDLGDFPWPRFRLPMDKRDVECCSLYFTATLVNSTLLSPITPQNDLLAIQSAVGLCSCFASDEFEMCGLQRNWPRNIFLAGLILKGSQFPNGMFLCN